MVSNDMKKYGSLVLLVLQGSTHALLIRYSQTIGATSYIPSTTVVVAELYKLLLTLAIVYFRDFADRSNRMDLIMDLLRNSSRASIPAILYALQNNLVFIALANLDAATFQVMYQSKIITTAVFSVLILGRKLSVTEIISLLLLFQGVVLVQTPPCAPPDIDIISKSGQRNVFLGFVVVMAISCTSGFAGVFLEKILKSGSGSPFARNLQLAFWGLIFSIIMMFYNDSRQIFEFGFFYGYNFVVWSIINVSALGGILIALVVVYTDNIAKGFFFFFFFNIFNILFFNIFIFHFFIFLFIFF